MHQVILRIR
jgi:hypothetical protein